VLGVSEWPSFPGERDEADGGVLGRVDQPAAGGRGRLPAGRGQDLEGAEWKEAPAIHRRGTIAEILKQVGLEPAPERERKGTWAEFLKTHWDVLSATDFFTVELWRWNGLVRYHVLFVLRLSSRKVHIAGIVPEPDGRWMKQVGRNLTDCMDGYLAGYRYLIHDRSSLFTKEFRSILQSGGVKSVRLPARSPNLNAFAERFVRSIKSECLDRFHEAPALTHCRRQGKQRTPSGCRNQGAGWNASFVSLCGAPSSHSPLATPAAPQGIK
jgi:transposase InsO family protein